MVSEDLWSLFLSYNIIIHGLNFPSSIAPNPPLLAPSSPRQILQKPRQQDHQDLPLQNPPTPILSSIPETSPGHLQPPPRQETPHPERINEQFLGNQGAPNIQAGEYLEENWGKTEEYGEQVQGSEGEAGGFGGLEVIIFNYCNTYEWGIRN